MGTESIRHLSLLLEALQPKESRVLGPIAHALLEPLRPTGQEFARQRGEPEGIEGIGTRGTYDRLLHGEWALLDMVPDEFLRRAADQELRFFDLAEHDPGPPTAIEVALDCGPAQFGAPRLVQAAGLLALQAQAGALGIPLQIRAPLSPEALDLTQGDWLVRWRALRSWTASPEPAAPEAGAQRFVIWMGWPGVTAPTGVVHLELTAQASGVLVRLRGQTLHLSLPELGEGAAVLRGVGVTDTPHKRVTAPRPITPRDEAALLPIEPGFFFSPSGSRLFCWNHDQRILWAISTEPHKRQIHHAQYQGDLGGVGWINQRLTFIDRPPEIPGGSQGVWQLHRKSTQVAVPPTQSAWLHHCPPFRCIAAGRRNEMLLLPPAGVYLDRVAPGVLYPRGAPKEAARWLTWGPQDEPVLDGIPLILGDNRALYAWEPRRRELPPRPSATRPPGGVLGLRVWGGFHDHRPLSPYGAFLWVQRDRLCILPRGADGVFRFRDLHASPLHDPGWDEGPQVEGDPAGYVCDEQGHWWLVCLDGEVVRLQSGKRFRSISGDADVTTLAVAPGGDTVAWLDRAGRLTLFQVAHSQILLQRGPP